MVEPAAHNGLVGGSSPPRPTITGERVMWTLEDFIRESNRIEGINREPTQEEIVAHEVLLVNKEITVRDLEAFVSIIQPKTRWTPAAILRNKEGLNVRVGDYYPPLGGPAIEPQLVRLLHSVTASNSFETHLAYEQLHPFTDGNGRSGRALWLWAVGGTAPLGFLHSFYYQTLRANQ